MICYRDTTFCKSDCTNTECPRHWSDEKAKKANAWWAGFRTTDPVPIAMADFSKNCPEYRALGKVG